MVRKTKKMKIRAAQRRQHQTLQHKEETTAQYLKIKNLLVNAKSTNDFLELGNLVVPEFIIQTHIEWLYEYNADMTDLEELPDYIGMKDKWPYPLRYVVHRYHDFITYTTSKFSKDDINSPTGTIMTNLIKSIHLLAHSLWSARFDALHNDDSGLGIDYDLDDDD